MEDYAEDSIIMTADGARVGIEVIRNFFITMFSALPNSKGANFDYEGAAKFSTAGSFNYGRLAYFGFSSTDSATNLAGALNASFSYGGASGSLSLSVAQKATLAASTINSTIIGGGSGSNTAVTSLDGFLNFILRVVFLRLQFQRPSVCRVGRRPIAQVLQRVGKRLEYDGEQWRSRKRKHQCKYHHYLPIGSKYRQAQCVRPARPSHLQSGIRNLGLW